MRDVAIFVAGALAGMIVDFLIEKTIEIKYAAKNRYRKRTV